MMVAAGPPEQTAKAYTKAGALSEKKRPTRRQDTVSG